MTATMSSPTDLSVASVDAIRSHFPALTIWQMTAGGILAPVDLAAGDEDVLVVRPLADVEARSIPKGSLEFIQALMDGRSVLAALEAALIASPRFDLSANLSDLMRAGALVGYSLAPEVS